MRFHKIYAMLLRYFYIFRHSYDRKIDTFYWPVIELVLWGITSIYFKTLAPDTNIIILIISGILFWIIVTRGQFEVSLNLLEELWNNNLINIFISPIRFSEWVASLLIMGVLKSIISFLFAAVVAFVLYQLNIFTLGLAILPFFLLLLIMGWWLGLLISSFILRYGTRIQTIAWSIPALMAPFSAVYYPVSILPEWAQTISAFLPSSYIFEGMREVIHTGYIDPMKLLMSFVLNMTYLGLSIIFLKKSFTKLLNRGMVHLE